MIAAATKLLPTPATSRHAVEVAAAVSALAETINRLEAQIMRVVEDRLKRLGRRPLIS